MCLTFRGNSWQSTENNSKQGAADLPKSFYFRSPSHAVWLHFFTQSPHSKHYVMVLYWLMDKRLVFEKAVWLCESRIADRDTSGACALLWHLAQITVQVVKPLGSFKMGKSVIWFLVMSTAACRHDPEWNRYGGIHFCKCWQEISAVFTRPFAKLRKTLKLWGETPDAGVLFQFKTCNQSHFCQFWPGQR